ncbi:MAG: glycosyltransferase family A protein [bacterium]|nr:glycosyltransferase family A protein [bacterium]
MISIVIPVYNGTATLHACLAAIAAQTLRDIEVIVVDDGSPEPLIPVDIPELSGRLRWVRQEHAGAPAARNRGADATRGELLLFCDADVVLRSHALATMYHALREHPEVSFAYPSFRFGWKRFPALPFDPERLRRMPFIHTTALLRREHFPRFDPTLARFQDWDLWLTMLERGHTGVAIPEMLFTITSTRGTMSRWVPSLLYRIPWKTARVLAYERARVRIFEKHGIDT